MSLWSRLANICRGDRLIQEIDEELEAHVEEAIAAGRDAAEARRAIGSLLQRREESRDIRVIPWLDAWCSDAIFGWRQLGRHKLTSAAALLSLGLTIGACLTAFRIIDALLLRPLPVAAPERLCVLVRHDVTADANTQKADSFEYPLFLALRAAAQDSAEMLAISYVDRIDVSYDAASQMEKAYRQYVSGAMFASLGLQPAVGRLLTEEDDRTPRAHPFAVISHDYWTRRFARDPRVVGRTLRSGDDFYEIVGVVDDPFSGTEPGRMTDIFVPAVMHPGVARADWSWLRAIIRLNQHTHAGVLEERLRAAFRAHRQETAKQFAGRPRQSIDRFLHETLSIEPAAAGVSAMQADYAIPLAALAVMVGLVLLIACANVANLMTARAAARAREMALRVSIGAGRWRLVQLVATESAWLAMLATAGGALFAWWAAPIVVSMVNPPHDPARLVLSIDWRLLAFGLVLAIVVTGLFGLAPALRASAVQPVFVLKESGSDSRRRLTHVLIAVQAAFCVVVVFVAGLLLESFDRLSTQPTGFSDERLLTLDATAPRVHPAFWEQVARQLAAVPGVESVATAAWPLLSGNTWNAFISIDDRLSEMQPYFLTVSPGWTDVLRIRLIDGRDFRADETYPGVAIVNEAFAEYYFGGENPVGRSFLETPSRGNSLPQEAAGTRYRVDIIGLVADAKYRSLREPVRPTVYVPFRSAGAAGALEPVSWGSFLVRTSVDDSLSLAALLQEELTRTRPDFRISSIRTQTALNQSHAVRERLLAVLALFFAGVALLLAGIGLCGVLQFSVLQRRREIGIRLALGEDAGRIARRVTADAFAAIAIGSLSGLMLAFGLRPYIESLLYDVTVIDPRLLATTAATMVVLALLSAGPAAINVARTDPAVTLRAD